MEKGYQDLCCVLHISLRHSHHSRNIYIRVKKVKRVDFREILRTVVYFDIFEKHSAISVLALIERPQMFSCWERVVIVLLFQPKKYKHPTSARRILRGYIDLQDRKCG